MTDQDTLHADLRELLTILGMGDHARPQSQHEVFQEALGKVKGRLDDLEFWIGIAGEAIDALDACAGDDEEGWDRQQHAETESARITAKCRARSREAVKAAAEKVRAQAEKLGLMSSRGYGP